MSALHTSIRQRGLFASNATFQLTYIRSWPAGWLVFLTAFFLNPLPVLRRNARWWLLRVLFRVLTPGISRVEVGRDFAFNSSH